MKIPRLLAPAATAVLIAATAVALAPAASASGHHRSHHRSHRSAVLPAASAVVPTPGQQVTLTPASDASGSTTASLDWTIPACRGTVYATFTLKQGPAVYLKDKGGVATAYTCQATPQTVTVRYSPADPSQGALSAGQVSVTTTTKPAATGSKTYKTATSTVTAVSSAPALPDASTVHPTPAAKQVAITVTGQQWNPSYATLDWTLPACTGTVHAYFQLNQGQQIYLQEKGSTAYPCTSTPQTLHVRYHGVDPSAGALTAGNVDLTTTTYAAATGSGVTTNSGYTLPGVLSAQGS